MNLYTTVKYILDVARHQPNVNYVAEGDVYEIMNYKDDSPKYSAVVVSQSTHAESGEWRGYSFEIFYIDRLTADQSNRLQVQNIAIEVLSNIAKVLVETGFETQGEIRYHTFDEKFEDLCAGAYMEIVLQSEESLCADGELPYIPGGEFEPSFFNPADYYTSAQTDDRIAKAIEEAELSGITLDDYWTSAQTQTAINDAVSGISVSGVTEEELNNAIAAETARTEETYVKYNNLGGNVIFDVTTGGTYVGTQDFYYLCRALGTHDTWSIYAAAQNPIRIVKDDNYAQIASGIILWTKPLDGDYQIYRRFCYRANINGDDYEFVIDITYNPDSWTVVSMNKIVTGAAVSSAITSALTDYYTSAQTDTAIQNTVSAITVSGVTRQELDNAIAAETARTEQTYAKQQSLGDYYTSAQTDTAIQNAISGIDLSDYYTSAQTDSAISSALTEYYTSGQTDSAIQTAVQDKVSSETITQIWTGSQQAYDAMTGHSANVLYVINS